MSDDVKRGTGGLPVRKWCKGPLPPARDISTLLPHCEINRCQASFKMCPALPHWKGPFGLALFSLRWEPPRQSPSPLPPVSPCLAFAPRSSVESTDGSARGECRNAAWPPGAFVPPWPCSGRSPRHPASLAGLLGLTADLNVVKLEPPPLVNIVPIWKHLDRTAAPAEEKSDDATLALRRTCRARRGT